MQEAHVKPNTIVFTKKPTCPNGERAWDTHTDQQESEKIVNALKQMDIREQRKKR